MGLFAFKTSTPAPAPQPAAIHDPQWARNKNGNFFKFTTLDPYAHGLKGVGGIYVMWNSGLKPRWLLCGANPNLGWALDMLEDDESVMNFSMHGLHITWSPIRAEFRSGVLTYMQKMLAPELPPRGLVNPFARPIPVLLPGQRAPAAATPVAAATSTPAQAPQQTSLATKVEQLSAALARPR